MIFNKQNLLNNLWYGENSHKSDQDEAGVLSASILPDLSRVWGIDISHWNGLTDLATAKANGCSFVIIKACDGSVPTAYYQENKQRAKDAGLPFGAYMWLYPNSKVPISTQVKAWWSLVKNDMPPLGVFMDVETTWYAGVQCYPGTSDAASAMYQYYYLSGRDLKVYTSPGYASAYLKGFAGYDEMWVAHYGVLRPTLPPGAVSYEFHQFTSNLPGELAPSRNKSLDGNYFNGTHQQFVDLYGGTYVPPIPPPPTGGSMKYQCTVKRQVKAYNSPSTDGPQNGYLNASSVPFIAKDKNADWIQHPDGRWANMFKPDGTLAIEVIEIPDVPVPPTKRVTNTITVYDNGSIDVTPAP